MFRRLSAHRSAASVPAALLAAALCATPLTAPAGGPPPAGLRAARQTPLPDLQVSQTRLRSSLVLSQRTFSANGCAIQEGCAGAAGTRRTLEFDTQIMNLGDADVILGTPSSRPDLFVFSPCHGHYHMNDSLDYSLARGGVDTIGSYNPATGVFYYAKDNDAGDAAVAFAYGPAASTWTPLSGDWDGDGDSTPGLYDPATGVFYLRNTNSAGPADMQFVYGPAGSGWRPLAGDWNGDGRDSIGLYDASTGVFYLRDSNDSGPASQQFVYGPGGQGWQPVVGDWDGDDDDTVGLFDGTPAVFYLKNTNSSGPADLQFAYGPPGTNWRPVAADWDITGDDSVGLYNPATGVYYLKLANGAGPADLQFQFGEANQGWMPIAGDWDYEMGPALPSFGAKQAFCWLDSARIQGNLPPHYNCGNQGITAGWSDIYNRGLDCQWIDITGVAPGDYQLRVNVNDSRQVTVESNYDNNTAIVKFRLTPSSSRTVSPEVTVTRPGNGDVFRVGRPMTIRWEVANGQNLTHQEIWLTYHKKKIKGSGSHKDDANPDRRAQVKIIAEGLAPNLRSFTFTPTEEFVIEGGQILVRSYDRNNLTAGDGRSRGQITIK